MADNDTKVRLCEKLGKFLVSPNLSDFTIVCNGTTRRVHRLALSLHSDVLAKACDGGFKESQEGKIDFSEHTTEQVDALVNYIYTFDYNAGADASHAAQMTFHTDVHILADMWDIPGLKKLSLHKFSSIIGKTTTSAEVAGPARRAYEYSDQATKDLRQVIVKYIASKKRAFMPDTPDNEGIRTVMKAFPELAIDIAADMSDNRLEFRYRCTYCQVVHAVSSAKRTPSWCPNCGGKQTPLQVVFHRIE